MSWMRWAQNTTIAVGVLIAGAIPSITVGQGNAVAFSSISGIRLNSFESTLINDVNNARASAGVAPLALKPGMQDLARMWAYVQANSNTMKHNLDLQNSLNVYGSAGWTYGAENVGVGPSSDPQLLFEAFMQSPGHKRNILDPRAKYFGLGAVETTNPGHGLVTYVTMDFSDAYSNSYGIPRSAAPGLKRDSWRPDSTHIVTPLRLNDQRIDSTRTGGIITGLVSSTHLLNGIASVLAVSDGGGAGTAHLTYHDALSLVPGTKINVKLSARSRTGAPVHVTVSFGNPAGGYSSIRTGVDLDSYGTTVQFTMPKGWTMPISVINVDVSRQDLVALSGTQSQRYARIQLEGISTSS